MAVAGDALFQNVTDAETDFIVRKIISKMAAEYFARVAFVSADHLRINGVVHGIASSFGFSQPLVAKGSFGIEQEAVHVEDDEFQVAGNLATDGHGCTQIKTGRKL